MFIFSKPVVQECPLTVFLSDNPADKTMICLEGLNFEYLLNLKLFQNQSLILMHSHNKLSGN